MSDGFLPMEKTWDMSESYRILRYPFSSLWCRRQQTSLGVFLLQLHLLPICLNRFSCESCRGWTPQCLCRRICCPHLGKTLHLNHVCLHHSSRPPSSTLPETLRSFSKTWFWQVCSLRILHLSLPGSTEKKKIKALALLLISWELSKSDLEHRSAHYPSLPQSHKPRLSQLPPRMDGWVTVQRKHQ